jgi:hypothetical protein
MALVDDIVTTIEKSEACAKVLLVFNTEAHEVRAPYGRSRAAN